MSMPVTVPLAPDEYMIEPLASTIEKPVLPIAHGAPGVDTDGGV
jgi:hypothetical protein